MPLSEEELRLLDQMERALVAEDPKLASTMRGTSLRAVARRRVLIAAVGLILGIAVLMTGAVLKIIPVAVVGFVIMLGSSYLGLTSWRNQSRSANHTSGPSASHPAFTVIDGGRKRRAPRTPRNRSASRGSMMQRFEERWRRRRDQNGF